MRKELVRSQLATARRLPAHRRHPARGRSVPRAAEERTGRGRRIQRLAHPDRRAAGCDTRAARRSRQEGEGRLRSRRQGRRFRRSWPSRTPTARRRSRAARSAGSRAPQVPTFLTETRRQTQAGEVSQPLRTPTGFHLVKLNEMRNASTQQIVDQVHTRHILMKPNEIMDDATVQPEAHRDPRPDRQGRGFRRPRRHELRGPDVRLAGRRSRLDGPRHLRAGIRTDGVGAEGKRDQRAVPDAVRLAHRAAARHAPVRQHRHQQAPAGRGCSFATAGRRKTRELFLRRLRDEAYVEYKL